jgi:integrase
MERAVAVALLIYCGLRISSLRTLELSDFRFTDNGRCILFVPRERTKGDRALEHDLNPQVSALLRLHIEHHRPELPGSSGSYLFPGEDGGARSKTALSMAICGALHQRAGLEMNVHLFRHAIAKIAVERDPGAYLSVSRVLGHSSLDTTMAHYLGTESKAAGRHLDRLLTAAKDNGNDLSQGNGKRTSRKGKK